MAFPLDYFAIDFQSNRNIPRCRRLLPYYWQRGLCQAVKTAVHEVARADVGGVIWQLLTPRDNVVQNRMVARHDRRRWALLLRRDAVILEPASRWGHRNRYPKADRILGRCWACNR
jgi:hypothetical protein